MDPILPTLTPEIPAVTEVKKAVDPEKGTLKTEWGFTTPFRAQFVGAGIWVVTEPLVYVSKKGESIVVPAGFPTDLTSVPRPLWWMYPPTGNYLPAAIVHDYLYWYNDRDRKMCDDILREAMEKCSDVGKFTRWAVYTGVRSGGWNSFKKHKVDRAVRDATQTILVPHKQVEEVRTVESILTKDDPKEPSSKEHSSKTGEVK